MRVKIFVILMVVMIPVGVISCGGGGGGGDSFEDLAGTWFGVWEDYFYEGAFNIQMTINSSGDITNVLEDGEPVVFGLDDTDLEGKLSRDSAQSYSIEWNDETFGGIIVDETNMHMSYVDDLFFVGILQKGASELPNYFDTDYEGTWRGYSVWVNEDLEIIKDAETVITVDSQADVIGTTVAGAFAGSLLGWFDQDRGVAAGEDTAGNAFFHIFLSVDKMFATTYSCPNEPDDFYDCEFGGWAKQVVLE